MDQSLSNLSPSFSRKRHTWVSCAPLLEPSLLLWFFHVITRIGIFALFTHSDFASIDPNLAGSHRDACSSPWIRSISGTSQLALFPTGFSRQSPWLTSQSAQRPLCFTPVLLEPELWRLLQQPFTSWCLFLLFWWLLFGGQSQPSFNTASGILLATSVMVVLGILWSPQNQLIFSHLAL